MKKLFFIVLLMAAAMTVHTALADELILPAGMKTIEAEAFMDDTSLDTVILPESLESIGDWAFANSSVKRIYLPETLTSIGEDSFSGCAEIIGYGPEDTVASRYFDDHGLNFEHEQEEWSSSPLNDFEFTSLSDDACEVKKYIGSADEVVIPKYDGQGRQVTGIGKEAFSWASLTSIEIPTSVTSIDEYAFYYCTSLKNIEIPTSVKHIGDYAFSMCNSLTSILLPDSVWDIGWYVFKDCIGLESVVFSNNVQWIAYGIFEGCTSLERISIPDSVYSVADYAFSGCTSLTSIVIPDSVWDIGPYAFADCTSLTSIVIPDSVWDIGPYAFANCASLTNIILSDSIGSIDQYTFHNCTSLTSIVIPCSVTSIGECSFYGCTNLRSIELPEGVTSIGEYAFLGCSSLSSIVIPSSVTNFGECAFFGCSSLTNIVIPDSFLNIGDYAFSGCTGLMSIQIPDSVTRIGKRAFSYCSSLTRIEIPDSVMSIGDDAFFDCDSLMSIEIPDSVTSIGDLAFGSCASLTSIVIPDSVTTIGRCAFLDCTSLMRLVILSSGTSIEANAFQGCTSLKNLVIPLTSDTTNILKFFPNLTSLKLLSGDTSIARYAFNGFTSLTNVEIPSSVTSIGDDAFESCASLKSIVIPSSVTSIGSWAFSNCPCLTSINIPDGVTSIEVGTFARCTSLTDIVIPSSVTRIDRLGFFNCVSLTSIQLPDNISFLGDQVFSSSVIIKVKKGSTTEATVRNAGYTNIKYIEEDNPIELITEGVYHIASVQNNSQVITVMDCSTAENYNIQMWAAANYNEYTFAVKYIRDGFYEIYSTYSGKAITILDSNIVQATFTGADEQLWSFEYAGNGSVYIRSRTGRYLGMGSSTPANHVNVIPVGGQTFAWAFVPWNDISSSISNLIKSIEILQDTNIYSVRVYINKIEENGPFTYEYQIWYAHSLDGIYEMFDNNVWYDANNTNPQLIYNAEAPEEVYIKIRLIQKMYGFEVKTYETEPVNALDGVGLQLNYSSYTLYLETNQLIQLEVLGTTVPAIWSSSDDSIAFVSNDGIVTGLKEGNATITARIGEKHLECQIEVNPVTYRALLVCNRYSGQSTLFATLYDGAYMYKVLSELEGTPYRTKIVLNLDFNSTPNNLFKAMQEAFEEPDENDVSLFYFSGHGDKNGRIIGNDIVVNDPEDGNYGIPPSVLKYYLDSFSGRHIVICNSCHSGNLISGRGKPDFYSFLTHFSVGLQDEKYYVFAAADANQLSYSDIDPSNPSEFYPYIGDIDKEHAIKKSDKNGKYVDYVFESYIIREYITGDMAGTMQRAEITNRFGVFTRSIVRALGYDYDHNWGIFKLSNMPADTDNNNKVSFKELYAYIVNDVASYYREGGIDPTESIPQVYPGNCDWEFFAR